MIGKLLNALHGRGELADEDDLRLSLLLLLLLQVLVSPGVVALHLGLFSGLLDLLHQDLGANLDIALLFRCGFHILLELKHLHAICVQLLLQASRLLLVELHLIYQVVVDVRLYSLDAKVSLLDILVYHCERTYGRVSLSICNLF